MPAPAPMPPAPAQPEDGDERSILLGWLTYQRDYLRRKCAALTPEQLVTRSVEPSTMSLLGLVRHLCEMEHVCLGWPWGEQQELTWVWGDYADGREDDFDCSADDLALSLRRLEELQAGSDAVLAAHSDLADVSPVIGKSLRWCVLKLLAEYAQHNGHADLLRERIDGQREPA